MKDYFFLLLAFLIGFSAVLGYQYFSTSLSQQTARVAPSQKTALTVEPTFALVPPSQAVPGILTVTSGHAEKLSRNETEYKEASTGAQILLGESIATKEHSSATASVSGIVNVSMGPVSELFFTNLFPANFVLQQKSGKINYMVTQPISVRALHNLVSIEPGETTIDIMDSDISITVKSGSVKFALIDKDNNTNIYSLKSGERANIDDQTRKVFFR